MRARAGSIAKQVDIPIGEARRIYKQEMGNSSPSGQTPVSLDWYFKSPMRRYQSALLLQLYAITSKKLDPRVAYASAFYHFSRLMAAEWQVRTGDPALRDTEDDYSFPYERGQFLVSYYSDSVDHRGKHLCDLMLRRCKACSSVFLAKRVDIDSKCPICAEGK
jgi:hypothetical protein